MNKSSQSTNAIAKIISKYYNIQKVEKYIKKLLLIGSLICFGMLFYNLIVALINFISIQNN